jgi:hypothetical protein
MEIQEGYAIFKDGLIYNDSKSISVFTFDKPQNASSAFKAWKTERGAIAALKRFKSDGWGYFDGCKVKKIKYDRCGLIQ